MKNSFPRFGLMAAFVSLVAAGCGAADSKSTATPPAKKADVAAQRHPLKGVVTGVDANLSAMRVKHEEIPGVMRAMTMLFKVDAATLKAVKTGDAITALMTREAGEWRLYEVKVVSAATK